MTYRFDVHVSPNEESDHSEPIFVDPIYSGDIITRYFDEDGNPSSSGSFFKVILYISTTEGLDGVNIRFVYDILSQTPAGYEPAKHLEPWLMMGGHGIFMDTVDQVRAEDKLYLHLHASAADESASFAFSAYNREGEIPPGVYKMWVQFKHAGKVLTFPFRFAL